MLQIGQKEEKKRLRLNYLEIANLKQHEAFRPRIAPSRKSNRISDSLSPGNCRLAPHLPNCRATTPPENNQYFSPNQAEHLFRSREPKEVQTLTLRPLLKLLLSRIFSVREPCLNYARPPKRHRDALADFDASWSFIVLWQLRPSHSRLISLVLKRDVSFPPAFSPLISLWWS